MGLIILDDTTVSVVKVPNGFGLRVKENEGSLAGLPILVTFSGEAAEEVYEAIGRTLGLGKPKVEVADKIRMAEAVRAHDDDSST